MSKVFKLGSTKYCLEHIKPCSELFSIRHPQECINTSMGSIEKNIFILYIYSSYSLLVGGNLSEPHISVNALHMRVCMLPFFFYLRPERRCL